MSPSENDLRAALQRGEPDGTEFDVDRIVEQGQLHLARRRVRMLSAAAVAAVVGVGIGAYALRGGDRSTTDASHRNPTVATAADGRAALAPPTRNVQPAARPAASGARAGAGAPASCPSTPQAPLPGSTGAAGGTRLFPAPVRSVVVCAYGAPGNLIFAAPMTFTLTGRDASSLVTSLENASRRNLVTPCPSGSSVQQRVLGLVGIQPDGARLPVVALTLSDPACNVSVTNGLTTRYDWTPDPALSARIFALTAQPSASTTGRPARIPTGRPPGGKQGSPRH